MTDYSNALIDDQIILKGAIDAQYPRDVLRPCGCTYDEACICDDPDFS
jgi:hypothetical protein